MVSGALGLATVLLTVLVGAQGIHASGLGQVAGFLLVLGILALWLAGLIGGILSTAAAVGLSRPLRDLDAALRHTPRTPPASHKPATDNVCGRNIPTSCRRVGPQQQDHVKTPANGDRTDIDG